MELRVLGPVEVWAEGRRIPLRGSLQLGLLGLLALHAGQTVGAARLIELLWGATPTAGGRKRLQWQVWQLRRALAAGGAGDRVEFRAPGYLLRVAPDELDLARFTRLVDQGRQALAAGEARVASQALRSALELWRGRPFEGVDVPELDREGLRLEERRLAAVEDRIEAELRLGGHAGLVAELTVLVAEQPFRERLHGQLMMALYRSGRPAEALAVFRDLRRRLVDELAIEPSASMRELERRMLAGDPALDLLAQRAGPARLAAATGPAGAAPAPVVPRQLPADIASFTGRRGELDQLARVLAAPGHGPMAISAIQGTGGIGKTALAIRAAHQVADRFRDGQFYVDLQGYAAGAPLAPVQALAQLLHALGLHADQIPVDVGAAAGLYRSLLADKRVLVVLDNARDAEQVRPLLPGSPGCAVLVTSRDRLTGLVASHSARLLTLGALTPGDAVDLLARIIGDCRVAAEPTAAEELARVCAYLPLALRIAAANLTCQPDQLIAGYVAELRAGGPLAGLAVGGDPQTAVSAAFDLSYKRLPPEARRLFRLLGLVPGPEACLSSAAALAGASAETLRPLVDALIRTHMVEQRGPGRFAFHDLLRRYAWELAEQEEDGQERDAAIRRLFAWYLHGADAAARVLYPNLLRLPLRSGDTGLPKIRFDDAAGALRWVDTERPNLVAAVRHAAHHGPHQLGWQLADTLRGYFLLRQDKVDWLAVADAGLQAAVDDGDRQAQAASHLSLGLANHGTDPARAVEHYASAIGLAGEVGWRDGHAAALVNLGVLRRELGDLRQAVDDQTQALALFRQTGSRVGEAMALNYLGALDHALGRIEVATQRLTRALSVFRELGYHYGEANSLYALAAAHRDGGRGAQAFEAAQAALAVARDLGDRHTELHARNTLASVHLFLGDERQAVEAYHQALDLARETGARFYEAAALLGLAAAHNDAARHVDATDHAEAALALASERGYQVIAGDAHTTLAEIFLARGWQDDAVKQARRAVAIHRQTGDARGHARARAALVAAGDQTQGTGPPLDTWHGRSTADRSAQVQVCSPSSASPPSRPERHGPARRHTAHNPGPDPERDGLSSHR